jgi:cephalosporin hydroxylase
MNLKIINLPGDSGDYDLITDAVERSTVCKGPAIEIGLRRGGGTKHIIDVIAKQENKRDVVAIDPYGNIDYNTVVDSNAGPQTVKMDYTNTMRNECLVNLYDYAEMMKVNFVFINLEDTEFMKRYADGIPIYQEFKRLESKYSFVHFDGPHFTDDVVKEIEFFNPRMELGATYVFDDVSYYDHGVVDKILLENGWTNLQKKPFKWSYQLTN